MGYSQRKIDKSAKRETRLARFKRPNPLRAKYSQPTGACMIAFPNYEKESGVLYVHFDENEKVYLVKEAKIGACVWRTEKEAMTFIRELLTEELKDGEEIGCMLVPVNPIIVTRL